jgi:predicted ATPase
MGGATRAGSLPSPGTSFVGREDELVTLTETAKAERLLTLHGAGGAGKTRLAVEFAVRLAPSMPDGVWFTDLAPLERGSSPWPTLAQVLMAREEPGIDLADSVLRALRGRDVLLVLDNCEHLLDGAREVAIRTRREATVPTASSLRRTTGDARDDGPPLIDTVRARGGARRPRGRSGRPSQ